MCVGFFQLTWVVLLRFVFYDRLYSGGGWRAWGTIPVGCPCIFILAFRGIFLRWLFSGILTNNSCLFLSPCPFFASSSSNRLLSHFSFAFCLPFHFLFPFPVYIQSPVLSFQSFHLRPPLFTFKFCFPPPFFLTSSVFSSSFLSSISSFIRPPTYTSHIGPSYPYLTFPFLSVAVSSPSSPPLPPPPFP